MLALLADSTNADKPGWTPSERVIDPAFDQVFRNASGRIIVATFASLISRMQQVANVAARYHRKLAFVGTSMIENAKMARKLGYLDMPDDLLVSVEQALKMRSERSRADVHRHPGRAFLDHGAAFDRHEPPV